MSRKIYGVTVGTSISPEALKNKMGIGSDSGQNLSLDSTLTQSGKAADAKAVGDALDKLEEKIPSIEGLAKTEDIPAKPEDIGAQPQGDYATPDDIPKVPNWAMQTSKPTYTASEVGADPTGTAASAVSEHNTSGDAHTDLRLLIDNLSASLANYQPKGDYALAAAVPTQVSQLTNDKGYLTEHQDISGKADKNQVATYITPEQYGAKGNGSTDDSAAIQAAIDAAGSGNIVYLAKKTYKISTGLEITHSRRKVVCDGTISYSGSGAAITIGSKNIDVSIAEIAAPNGTAVKVEGANKYIEQCDIKVGSVSSSKIGLHLRTDTVSITYNQFRIGYISASEIGVYVECHASYINENWYHLGKITGCKIAIKLYSDSSLNTEGGFGTNDNRFMSGSFEGIASDGCAIWIQHSSGNKFANFRCAENYGEIMVAIKGYSKANDIELSRIFLRRIDISEHTGGDNTIFRSAWIGDILNGFYCGTEARLDEVSGITYDSRYAKVSQDITASSFSGNVITAVNRMIPNSLYFTNENINGMTFKLGHVYSHVSSMSRGNPVVMVFGDTGGRVLVKDMNGDTILDNTNGELEGKTVTVKWAGIDKASNKNVWDVRTVGVDYATESFVQKYAQPKGNYLTDVPTGYATEEFVTNKIAEAELDGKEVDLSDYAQKSELPTKVSQLENDKGYLTKAPVTSVNGQTGAVTLDAAIVGARPSTWMPSASDVGALPVSTKIPTVTEAWIFTLEDGSTVTKEVYIG